VNGQLFDRPLLNENTMIPQMIRHLERSRLETPMTRAAILSRYLENVALAVKVALRTKNT